LAVNQKKSNDEDLVSRAMLYIQTITHLIVDVFILVILQQLILTILLGQQQQAAAAGAVSRLSIAV
jgi:hypothetical protein